MDLRRGSEFAATMPLLPQEGKAGVSCLVARATYVGQIMRTPGGLYVQAALGLDSGMKFANPKWAPLLLMAGERNLKATRSILRTMYRLHKRLPAPAGLIEPSLHSYFLLAKPGWEGAAGAIRAWIETSTR